MLITVEVAGKFGPKVNGEFLGIDRDSGIRATDFVAGQTYDVEVAPWKSKGGKSGLNIVKIKEAVKEPYSPKKSLGEASVEVAQLYSERANTERASVKPTVIESSEDRKSRRILYQGLVQASLASPSVAGLPFTNITEFMANVKEVVRLAAEFVTEEAR